MMNKTLRDKIPSIKKEVSTLMKTVKVKDEKNKEKSKLYFDKKNNVKYSNIEVGDWVVMRQKEQSKITTKFDNNPLKVMKVKGTAITVNKNGREIMRNANDLKKVQYNETNLKNENLTNEEFDYQFAQNELQNNENIDNENILSEVGSEIGENENNESNEEHEGNGANENNETNESHEETENVREQLDNNIDLSTEEEGENQFEVARNKVQNNKIIPKRNQNIIYKTRGKENWIQAKTLNQQPKRTGIHKNWVNIHNYNEEEPHCINWDSIESWQLM